MIAACVFADKELAYLRSQPLGRLATVAPDGQPDNAAVGFRVEDDGTIVVTGMNLSDSRKGRNVAAGNPKVAFIVDDLESVDPWRPRGIRIFGEAELVLDAGRSSLRIVPSRRTSSSRGAAGAGSRRSSISGSRRCRVTRSSSPPSAS